jgi:hypothetical protein
MAFPRDAGVPERLIVGNERAFLTWFYEGDDVVNHAALTSQVVDEYLRTFGTRPDSLVPENRATEGAKIGGFACYLNALWVIFG